MIYSKLYLFVIYSTFFFVSDISMYEFNRKSMH